LSYYPQLAGWTAELLDDAGDAARTCAA
jgi:hypothetical protein